MSFFRNMSKFKYFILVLLIYSCSSLTKEKIDPVTGKKVENFEPNSDVRARKFADENPIAFFGDRDKNKKTGNLDFEFGSSNVLWRATLKNLDFLPLINSDYRGGVIIYDWYSTENNPKEQIKISVQLLSNELRSDSIKITAHKKICQTIERCSNSALDQDFANSIKERIINSARILKIEEAKKEKK